MPYAITLCFDPVSAAKIETLWRALAAQAIDDDRLNVGYPAHVTLAIYRDETPPGLLSAATGTLAAKWRSMAVRLCGFGLFPAPSNVIWLAPAGSSRLLLYHSETLAALPGLEPEPHYRAAAWVPHVTLSGTLRDPAQALRALLPLWRPMTGVLDRVEVMRFRPVEMLSSRALPPGDNPRG